jgi:uncharacterized protein YoxC
MILSFGGGAAWLLLQAQSAAPVRALSDTLLMRQVGRDPGWFEQLTSIASGLMSLAILVLTIALVPAAWNFRKSYDKINKLLERVYGDINPLVRHAHAIADNVDYITTSIRTDVQQVNATVAAANQRLHQAVLLAEERLAAFNALLDVAQHEAERAFVNTAATMHGVRTGAAALRADVEAALVGRPRPGMDPIDELDELDELLPEELELLDELDDEDANGDDESRASEPGPARPRVRPRGRRS